MLIRLDRILNKIYKLFGVVASLFLVLLGVFIVIGILSRVFNIYIRGLSEYAGYCMAAATFFALAFTFVEGGHIRITVFTAKFNPVKQYFVEIWCLFSTSILSGYLAFYLSKMTVTSYEFQERSEGADEILIWIPQSAVALGSLCFFICVLHKFIKQIVKQND